MTTQAINPWAGKTPRVSTALFSHDQRYRYTLERVWEPTRELLLTCMLNPSTADVSYDDPTVTRVITRAQRLGFGGVCVVNMYAFRSPDQAILRGEYDCGKQVIGELNEMYIEAMARKCTVALVAWGNSGMASLRDEVTLDLIYQNLMDVRSLGLTGNGFPKHPLHVAYSVPMSQYRGRFAR